MPEKKNLFQQMWVHHLYQTDTARKLPMRNQAIQIHDISLRKSLRTDLSVHLVDADDED